MNCPNDRKDREKRAKAEHFGSHSYSVGRREGTSKVSEKQVGREGEPMSLLEGEGQGR